MPVTVLWGNDRLQFDLPSPDTTLASLTLAIAAYTQLSPDAFSLVHDGAVMRDDAATIAAYHLRHNSTIAIVTASNEQPGAFRNTEHVQIAAIHAELNTVRTNLAPAHATFLSSLTPAAKKGLTKEHARLSELLLQSLLRVDGIIPERNWDSARATRKAAVKELQTLLDQLDAAWAAA